MKELNDVPPFIAHRVAQDLTERQREVLQTLSRADRLPFREIRNRVANPPPDRTLREDLIHLKRLGLVESKGHGRGSTWAMTRS